MLEFELWRTVRFGYIVSFLIDKETSLSTDLKKDIHDKECGIYQNAISYEKFVKWGHKKDPNYFFKADKTDKIGKSTYEKLVSSNYKKKYIYNIILRVSPRKLEIIFKENNVVYKNVFQCHDWQGQVK